MSSSFEKTAVLLLAHGTPNTLDEIPEFLRNVTGGRPIRQALIDEITHRYSLIGRSPQTEITMRQAEGLAREIGLPVYVGMRNWTPYIKDVVAKMASDGIQRAVVICMAPQNSRTSVGLYKRALLGESGQAPFEVDFVESWHDHPLLISAFAERMISGWFDACSEAGKMVPVIFTAHSVPVRTIAEGDPYEAQARQTAHLVSMSVPPLSPGNWSFAFQSQGMSGGEWIGPTVEETILSLKQKGHTGVFIQPVGFVCDHVEVLYDIDIGFRQFASNEGMKLWRAESLNDSPLLIAALADLARSRVQQPRGVSS